MGSEEGEKEKHRMLMDVSRGSLATLYTVSCECGWIGGSCNSPGPPEADFKLHAEGKRPPWQMEPGKHRKPEWMSERGFREERERAGDEGPGSAAQRIAARVKQRREDETE